MCSLLCPTFDKRNPLSHSKNSKILTWQKKISSNVVLRLPLQDSAILLIYKMLKLTAADYQESSLRSYQWYNMINMPKPINVQVKGR